MSNDRRRREEEYGEIPSAREWAKYHESFGRTSLKIPEGVSMFAIKKPGVYKVDIIPYVVGKGNPSAQQGKIYWQRTYFNHRNVGPNQNAYACPAKTAGLKCPICEDVTQQFNNVDPSLSEREIKSEKQRIGQLAAKERQLFNVIDLDNPDPGIQIWETSYHLFGRLLKDRLDNLDVDEDYDYFHHPVRGYTLRLTASEETAGTIRFCKVSAIDFKPRKEPYKMDIIRDAYCLDELPKVLSYDELSRIYLGELDEDSNPGKGDDNGQRSTGRMSFTKTKSEEQPVKGSPRRFTDEDEDKPAPRTRATAKAPAEQEDDNKEDTSPVKGQPKTAQEAGIKDGALVYYNGLECEVIHISRDGTSVRVEDNDGQEYHAVAPHQLKLRTPPPPAKDEELPKAKVKASSIDEDDDYEDDEDNAPPPRRRRK